MHNLDRREFIKLLSLASLGYFSNQFSISPKDPKAASGKANVIILVFDTLSAKNVSLYGYRRETMPHLARFADRSTVFHNHYASAPYTTPGTASILTGNHAWHTRAFDLVDGVDQRFVSRNLFSAFEKYHRIAYTQNPNVEVFFYQFLKDLEYHKPLQELFLADDFLLRKLLWNDYRVSQLGVHTLFTDFRPRDGMRGSLLLSYVYDALIANKRERILENYQGVFPRGLPSIEGDNYFLLEDSIDWIQNQLAESTSPLMGYFHLMPPHFPYTPRKEFVNAFLRDGDTQINKPDHPFVPINFHRDLLKFRRKYDEYILFTDSEIGRLMGFMEENKIFEDSWVVITSDHGELFERGIWGHLIQALYEPLVRVPLLISAPGQTGRKDVFTPTSAIDVLPTLLHVTGQAIPDWVEGKVLPSYRKEADDPLRPIFSIMPKQNPRYEPIREATVSVRKGPYKLIKYMGFKELANGGPLYEMYNVEDDPEEVEDIYAKANNFASELRDELEAKLEEVNKPY